jgi:ATP-dependent Clp protease ATP-binding subunit ClpC
VIAWTITGYSTDHFAKGDDMFERYTESARRLLFFARYETSATGSLSIESEHMLLALLREPGAVARRLLTGAGVSLDRLRDEITNGIPFREKVPTSQEIPFSEPTQRILTYAAEEADALGHSHIGSEHILLALLRVPESGGGAILTGHGLQLQTAREAVRTVIAEGAPPASRGPAATAGPQPTAQRVDTEGITADIDRIQRLVERISMTLATPHEAQDALHLLHIELASLRSRFS